MKLKNIKKIAAPRNIFLVVKKELKAYFDSPTAYVVLLIFLLLWEFLFFRGAFVVGAASLRPMFGFLPWLFLLLCPAITMGAVSQEKSEGTLEFLLTHPVKDTEVLLGKFLAALGFITIALLLVLPVALTFSAFGNLDWGVVLGQYLASLFLAGLFISLGVFVSCLFKSQISSLLVSVVASFLLLIIGTEIVTIGLPFFLGSFFEKLSGSSHFGSMARGTLDLRDLWYFVSMAVAFLTLGFWQLQKRRCGRKGLRLSDYKLGIIAFIVVVVLTNLMGHYIPGRVDLTQNRLYTITKATKQILSGLKNTVEITLYATELPPQFQPLLRDTKDILRDYKTLAKGKVILSYKNPSDDQAALEEAISLGIQEAQFNVIGEEEFKTRKGFLGLTVSAGDETETIPFLQSTSDLEYQLTSFITKLTSSEKKTITFLAGHGEKTPSQGLILLGEALENQFEIKEALTNEEAPELPTSTDVLVVAGPTEKIDETTQASIKEFLDSGGAALFLIDTITVNPQGLLAATNTESFAEFAAEYGAAVETDVIYDIQSKETVRFGGGIISFFLPYPFWPRLISSDQTSVLTSQIKNFSLPWASSITLNQEKLQEKNLTASILFSTTEFGGRQKGIFFLSPEQRFSKQGLSEQTAVVGINKQATEGQPGMRLIVVGDSEFLADGLIRDTNGLGFGLEAVSWLAQEQSLASIQLKQRQEGKLQFKNKKQVSSLKYGNMAFVLVAPLSFGAVRLLRRRRLRRHTYSSRH